jgi:hypothetical protein
MITKTSPNISSAAGLERCILKQANFSLTLDFEVPCMIWKMKGVPPTSEHYRSSVISFLDAFTHFKNKLPRLQAIVDGTAVGGIKPNDLEWACHFWAEKVKDYGQSLFAMVRPKSVFGQVALDTYLSFPHESWVEIKVFEDLEEAKAWIRMSDPQTL